MTAVDAAGRLVPFDPTQPVGEGVTLLEASAGTGKTHAVASLVVAEVARGRPLDELLVVTFTRKATGTLRERVWQRLAAAAAALDPATPVPGDDLHRHLATGTPDEVAQRRVRLGRALSDFDATTIATTHGFCQQVLISLGVAGDAERNVELLEDVGDLVDDAVDDLFVRRFHSGGDVPFDRAAARRIARAVVENPDAEIAHVDRDFDPDLQRRRFADTLRRRIAEQKRRGRLITFDDLLGRLDRSLADAVRGTLVAERLRRRFSMAVVDEFQDTDTVQWRILRSAFGSSPSRLVLVGDPKQAIYAFRGGDVHAYREATAQATATLGLGVSWRSDQRLLDGIDAFLAGAQLGGPGIVHRPLLARPGAEAPRLLGAGAGQPLTVRIVDRRSGHVACTRNGWAEKSSTRRFIADDVAGEAVRLLTSGCEVVERDGDGTASSGRPLGPGDLAVLVRSHRDGETVRQALVAAGVPAVVHGGTEVIKTDAGQAWLDLLRALEQPSATRVRTVAAGPFLGWDGERLATAPDGDWDEVDERLHEWAAALRTSGVAAVVQRIEATVGLTARLLGEAGGERRLSDLRHVAELLHARHAAHPASAAGLAGWLIEQRAATPVGEAARRRLESDAPAVTVQTIHGAKGLEFPVVLLPSLWEGPWADEDDPPIFHDDQGVRCIGVGSQGQIHRTQVEAAARERAEEELRLLYVAVTRARHRVVLWWATAADAGASPFARILLGRDRETGAVRDELGSRPTEEAIRRELEARSATCAGAIAVEDATGPPPERLPPPPAAAADLSVKAFGRVLDDRWVRTSYSGLTAAAHDALVPSEPPPAVPVEAAEVDERAKVDEPATAPGSGGAAGAVATPVPLSGVPGGARIGSLVHEILEATDFAGPDLAGGLAAAAARAGAARLLGAPANLLVAGLEAALSTPLGPLLGERRLRDLTPADRLDELSFDLPLAGGDTPTGVVTMAAVADVFAAHLPAGGLLEGYAERLRDPLLSAEVRGFLTGSIDLVARVDGRHVVIDYKTNRLAPPDEPVTAWHYRPEALAAAMQDAHYPLQAAVYAVALHRYLRWRLPGYDPARHLGGAAYLFLRGMTGIDAPRFDGHPSGVFSWPMPVAFVTDLSDLFNRGVP